MEYSEPLTRPLPTGRRDGRVGFLLVGHGTRRTTGQEQVRQLYRQFATLLAPNPSELAFLELAEPDIPTAVARLAGQGVSDLVTVPALLFSAGHAQCDIPTEVETAARRWNLSVLAQSDPLESCEPLIRLSALRFRETVCSGPNDFAASEVQQPCSVSCLGRHCPQVGLAIIGRGSRSASATGEMLRFAELRRQHTPVAWQQTGFIYGQQPGVEQVLEELARTRLPLAVVQPHLLFEGQLIDSLRAQVSDLQSRNPAQKWMITETLGTDASLAQTLVSLAKQAYQGETPNLTSGSLYRS